MKIAIITSGFLPVVDGVTITGYARVQQLSKKGHQVLLFCPDYSKIAHIYPDWQQYTGEILPGVTVINLPSTAFFVEFERNVAWYAYGKLQQELAAFQPDIIHVDEPERLFFGLWRIPGLRYARRHNIPCIGFFRTNFIEYAEDFFAVPTAVMRIIQWLIKHLLVLYVYNAYDLTLVTSKITAVKIKNLGIKNTYYDNFLGIKVKKYNSLQRQADFFAQKYNLPELDNKVKLIFLGRLTPEKGWNFTLKHLEQILQHIDKNKVAFLIVGDGELKDKIADKMKETPCFHLFGRVAPDDVPALLINSDIHVTTSEKETRGLTVLEAFTASIPVLAPRSEGIVENIESGNNGFLYNPGDITDFIDKLQTLIEDSNLRRQMGERGRVSINNKYTWDVAIDNLIEVWQKQIEIHNS